MIPKEKITFHVDPGDIHLEYMMQQYQKIPLIVKAVQMAVDFRVLTLEGLMYGKPNDYLVKGIEGEFYPVKKEIFEKSYCKV